MSGLLKGLGKLTRLDIWSELGEGLLDIIVDGTIGPLLWALCDIFFVLLDIFESLFKAFAGVAEDGVTIHGQRGVTGDIVLFLMESDIVADIFISMMILSWILLIIFTIFAIVKNQYSEKQEPVSKIINSSFKGLFMYLLVPVATVVCLIVGNAILQAIDGATRANSNASKLSGMVFVAAAYNANALRDSSVSDARDTLERWYNLGMLDAETRQLIADAVGISSADDVDLVIGDSASKMEIVAEIIDDQAAAGKLGFGKWHYTSVRLYYHPFQLSYITIWIGGGFLIWAIGKICWGLLARIFKMTLYYAISPILMATYPIDNGGALGKWRSEMVKLGTSAYAAVGVTNIMYSIIPVFNNIDIGWIVGGGIIKLFILIVAFSSVSDLIKTISGWFGVGDALSDGVAAKKTVKDNLGKATKKVSGTFNGLVGGYKEGKLGGALLGAWKGSGLAESTGIDPVKWVQDGAKQRKEAGQYYKDVMTNVGPETAWVAKHGPLKGKTLMQGTKAHQARFRILEDQKAAEKKIAEVNAQAAVMKVGKSQADQDRIDDWLKKQEQRIKSETLLGQIEMEKNKQYIEDKEKEKQNLQEVVNMATTLNNAITYNVDLHNDNFGKLNASQWKFLQKGNLAEAFKGLDSRTKAEYGKLFRTLKDEIMQGYKEEKVAEQAVADRKNIDTKFADLYDKQVGADLTKLGDATTRLKALGDEIEKTMKDAKTDAEKAYDNIKNMKTKDFIDIADKLPKDSK